MDVESEVYDRIISIVSRVVRVVRVNTVDEGSSFFDLGVSSLALIQIVTLIQEERGIQVDILSAVEAPSVASFVRAAAAV